MTFGRICSLGINDESQADGFCLFLVVLFRFNASVSFIAQYITLEFVVQVFSNIFRIMIKNGANKC